MSAEPTRGSEPRVAIVDDERFGRHRPRGYHPERPERLDAAREGLYAALAPAERTALAAVAALPDELARVHSPGYLARLQEELHGGRDGYLDPDTYFSGGSREAAWAAAGAGAAVARHLMAATSTRAFALIRPPGHHATPERSMGFCMLNNVAVAARAARAAGARRVAIVDWDVHHGNGTQDAFEGDPSVLLVSLHQWPFYPGTGAAGEIGSGAGRGRTANLALPAGTGPEGYGLAFRRVVLPLLERFEPDVVLVSAGYDAHARDPLAEMELDAATYSAMASAIVAQAERAGHGRVGLLLEGGYDLVALEESVRASARALRGDSLELPTGRVREAERVAIACTVEALEPFWPGLREASDERR